MKKAFIVDTEVRNDGLGKPYGFMELNVVKFEKENGSLKILNYTNGFGGDDMQYADLVVVCYADDEHTYGWAVEYRDVFSVNLEKAEAMVKMLRKVKRRRERLAKKERWLNTFADFVWEVAAHVLGIRHVIETVVRGRFYSEGQHVVHEGAKALLYLAEEEKRLIEKVAEARK